jgi:hypothetical protein
MDAAAGAVSVLNSLLTMINKLFYSVYLAGEKPINDYQLYWKKRPKKSVLAGVN